MNINQQYEIEIFERYENLKKTNKEEFNNFDLCKIFEYYTCLKLSEERKNLFYCYEDIKPDYER